MYIFVKFLLSVAFLQRLYDNVEDGVDFMAEKYQIDNYSKKATEESLKSLEQRYEKENIFIKAVSQGNVKKCEEMLNKSSFSFLAEKRVDNPIRNIQNYSIILNTLLRKAAEYGKVHPFYIDKISSDFAVEIEKLSSIENGKKLHYNMIHIYCELVRLHSSKEYSPIIQKLTTRIDADLTADLTLRTQADELGVNASYLSNLFKKEVGTTYTDYVNKKRVEYAEQLLKTTNDQIQIIAQQCGIFDLNYFSKLFKKYIGLTPIKYREASR